ncbi:uncharacterized protein BDV14DRAFT_176726 [Aspergillus stella-maris]|uniref:uncharacterized protein n=1 Tax=Aspergillus stella-maris TaxID=1810926 RepID=UPI003CCD30DA
MTTMATTATFPKDGLLYSTYIGYVFPSVHNPTICKDYALLRVILLIGRLTLLTFYMWFL